MTRDEELIQRFETKTGDLLQKAQQYLTTALPGGPGVFAYVVLSNLVGKLFGNTKEYVENAVSRPVTVSDFIYVEPLDEELEEFFEDESFKSLREEFPENYEDFTNDDWMKMRQYYKPLYYALYYKDPFMTEMFSSEIQSQNYKRIIADFKLLPLYKEALNSIPSAPRQHALWTAATSVLKGTVQEVWSKDYAKQLFEEAQAQPEIAELIENIKTKIGEKVDLEQLKELWETGKYLTGRSASFSAGMAAESAMMPIEYVANVSSEGQIQQILIPEKTIKRLGLKSGAKIQVFILQE